MQSPSTPGTARRIVILGTGGTIAGTAATADDTIGYRAAQRGIDELIAAVPPLAGRALEAEQIAQIDSKDMDGAVWSRLARRCAHHLAREDVAGLVITHGTDTLEETAWLLQRVLAPRGKPVVLTAAMRPATALSADGPRNLLDAVDVAGSPGAQGVVAVVGGAIFAAQGLHKWHPHALEAFSPGDAGPIGHVDDGVLRLARAWPAGEPLGIGVLAEDGKGWPVVEIVTAHAGARGETVDALVAAGAQGLVVAATGNGTLHHALEEALRRAQQRGIPVLRASRCLEGPLLAHGSTVDEAALPAVDGLTPVQARVELQLQLLARR